MKKSNFYVFVLAMMLAACDQTSSVSIGYVDPNKVLRDSKAGKSLFGQVRDYNDKVSKRLDPESKRLKRERERLARQSTTLSAAALQQKERAWQEKAIRLEQKVRAESERLQAGVQDAQAVIQDELDDIYEDVRDERGLDLLLNAGVILGGEDGIDYTNDVIEKLDEKLEKVKLEVPKE